MTLEPDSDFDIFVSYHERGASDEAGSIYYALQEKGYKVYVNHILKIKRTGKFTPDINEIINNCKIFVLLNTFEALERDEIINEVKIAFPNGSIKHDFWILREGRDDVPRTTERFSQETSINLEDLRQDDFSNESDLVRTVLRKCKARRESKSYEPLAITVNPIFRPIVSSDVRTKYEDLTSAITDQIFALRKILDIKFADKDFKEAEKIARQILDIDSTNASALNALGIIFAVKKEYQEADKFFAMACLSDKGLSSPWNNRAVSAFYQGKFNEGLFFVNKALDLDPRDTEYLNLKGSILDMLGKLKESQDAYSSSLDVDRDNSETLSSKASVEYKLGNKPQAISLLNRSIGKNKNNANAWYNLGVIYYDEGKFEDSLKCFEKAINLSKDPRSFGYKAIILRRQARYGEALQAYDKAIEIDGQDPELYYNKGVALGFMEKENEALQSFDQALKINPMHVGARVNRAVCLYKLNKKDEALNEIRRAIELDSNNIVGLNLLATLLEERKKVEESGKIYEKIIELDFKNIDNRLVFINSLTKNENYEKALSLVQESKEVFPNVELLEMYESHILIRLGQLDLALELCDSILGKNPNNATANYNKACILSIKGKKDEAILFLEKAIKSETKFKELARDDKDFNEISKDPRFFELTST